MVEQIEAIRRVYYPQHKCVWAIARELRYCLRVTGGPTGTSPRPVGQATPQATR